MPEGGGIDPQGDDILPDMYIGDVLHGIFPENGLEMLFDLDTQQAVLELPPGFDLVHQIADMLIVFTHRRQDYNA